MSAGNRMKAKGTAFETQVVDYLKEKGFDDCYRPATSGAMDSGDINGIKGPHRQSIIQCKNHKAYNLSGWLNDAVTQSQMTKVGGDALPVVVFKRPGVGTKTLGNTYALLRLEDLAELMKEAGYS